METSSTEFSRDAPTQVDEKRLLRHRKGLSLLATPEQLTAMREKARADGKQKTGKNGPIRCGSRKTTGERKPGRHCRH